jgi:hypothetical protein
MALPPKKHPDGKDLLVRLLKSLFWLAQQTDGLMRWPEFNVGTIAGMLSLMSLLYRSLRKLYAFLKKRHSQEKKSEPQDRG